MRAAVVRPDGTVEARYQLPLATERPFAGLVEQDAAAIASGALEVAQASLHEAGAVAGVGVTNQRGTTVVWDATTGEPIGPALSWQDLRTVFTCLELQAEGLRLAPNESATKLAWLLDNSPGARSAPVRFGTLDSWVVWNLTNGEAHVTDYGNACISGLLPTEAILAGKAGFAWDPSRLQRFSVPESALPSIVPSSGRIAEASALPGHPPICGIAGDQQASLLGQGCVQPGQAKATFGTGAFLDMVVGPRTPPVGENGKSCVHGCLPMVTWQKSGSVTWGVEALMLSAGTAVSWLVDDLGVLANPAESAEVAARAAGNDEVSFVPALLGLGTPHWDFGARSLLIGMSAGTGRPELVRAVLRGVAQRGADLLEAAEADSGFTVARLRADGGMTANDVFAQELADACQRPVEISAELEATTLGAGLLAGLGAGVWSTDDEVAAIPRLRAVIEPAGPANRERWREAVARSQRWLPDLSALSF